MKDALILMSPAIVLAYGVVSSVVQLLEIWAAQGALTMNTYSSWPEKTVFLSAVSRALEPLIFYGAMSAILALLIQKFEFGGLD